MRTTRDVTRPAPERDTHLVHGSAYVHGLVSPNLIRKRWAQIPGMPRLLSGSAARRPPAATRPPSSASLLVVTEELFPLRVAEFFLREFELELVSRRAGSQFPLTVVVPQELEERLGRSANPD